MKILMQFLLLFITVSCSNTSYKSIADHQGDPPMQERLIELKPTVKSLFSDYLEAQKSPAVPAEERIQDYVVHEDIGIMTNDDHAFFVVAYDTLPNSKEFVLAGSGELEASGWVMNRGRYVEIEEADGGYRIKSLSSGP